MRRVKIAMCQCNPTVGDLEGNGRKIEGFAARAKAAGADLAVFSELALVGYPPRDLLIKDAFIRDELAALEALASRMGNMPAIVGFVSRNSDDRRFLHNSAAVITAGRITAVAHKRLLPTYDVFDEERYFAPGEKSTVSVVGGARLGVTICEDGWNDADFWRARKSWSGRKTYPHDPVADAVRAGADVIVNLSASPYSLGKESLRREMFAFTAAKYGRPVVFVNQVGGNDELVFDGRSFAIGADGRIAAAAKAFEEDMVLFDTEAKTRLTAGAPDMPAEEEVFRALVLGTRDYARKCGFTKGVVGLSGGVDSALVGVIAAEALGPKNVTGVLMPSMYSSPGSISDATALVRNLGMNHALVPIADVYKAFLSILSETFAGTHPDVTEENIQARVRGTILMAISNKFGGLLLSTGNKSEVSTGYCTLYGDMAGGLDVLGDVLKTSVYRIARWVNRNEEVIPQGSITKPPSAELKPNQTDQDTLPPYEVLDAILREYVEEEKGAAEIVAMGFDAEVVARTIRMVDSSEYKRKQAAPVLKVTGRAFGFGRRMPMAQRYRQKTL